ncbi:MAG TPA: GDSL-type esterase/lipase family protein [Flavisolibacter sp.]|nr:GDSL-type esterase/lipase family protein [Flavisolibacter sp.]
MSVFLPRGQVLFIGSSSFTRWTDIQAAFGQHAILNRGFGGSSLTDIINYANEIIFPYSPKQIVIYCGENDIASSDTVTGRMVFERFKALFSITRKKLPNVPIAYVSMKPSPSRWQMRERMMEGNKLIKAFLAKQKGTKYINIWNAMLGTDGKPIGTLFVADSLHMNKRGYAIWQRIIEPHLLK